MSHHLGSLPTSLNTINRQDPHLSFALLLFSLILGACGKIGEPLPPLIRIPLPVGDLAAHQQGRQILLSWTAPRLNTDGSSATTIAAVEIFRVIRQPGTPPASAETLTESDRLQVLPTGPSHRPGREGLSDLLEGLENQEIFNREISYAVKVFNSRRQAAGFSNITTVKLQPVTHPPQKLDWSPHEAYIEISWIPSFTNIDGSPASPEARFNVYRSLQSGDQGQVPINPSPVVQTFFRDESARFGKEYCYRVRAVVETPAGPVESRDSEEISVVYQDVYPPAPPVQLTIVTDRKSLSLVWFPNSEPDLAGYHVYRSQGEGEYERLTLELKAGTVYQDRNVERGQGYSYRVTAVDRLGNESGYSKVVSDGLE